MLISALTIFFVVVSLAFRGVAIAKSVVAVVVLTVACFAVFALMYACGVVLSRLVPAPAKAGSPFARDELPPRHVAPENE